MSLASPLFFIGRHIKYYSCDLNTFGSRSAQLNCSCEHFGELLSFLISLGMVDPCVNTVESNS